MSLSGLKQLFLVGFLGFALVGCSSTPTTEESGSADAQAETAEPVVVEQTEVVEVVEATNDAGQTAAELKATLQGKVVNFDFDRSEVKAEFYEIIKLNADYMALDSTANVTIKGYCDERGTREYNLALGERRANAVKNALVAEGVSPSRINVISYGEEDPVDPAHTEAAWAKNRRAEFSY
ncbi:MULTISPECIES: peptidoglycan-associated lipoprotein Pal [Piscirickettsiaceae]|jgi:peptidoglycan-associated lipoprotein|uniref:Peptidoglycan-associated lipoprotein n=1 Tax=Hydrogenovibrio thermophilus TaxID=265883 RepID=A0A410H3W1_9GAMM|nr:MULTISPECIES: peptidoglycan-associated lipoprotein Pal [Piscirickettsiaceae]AZR81859.1 cell envelope biogenesis protein OmpA [Thiomicrospira sp. S5]QAB15609.1 peptidoglycan-associated lipoprotein Pal [Hydrogenovibrio thermophilus]